jgi:hypothetical protein
VLTEWAREQRKRNLNDHLVLIYPINSANIIEISERLSGLNNLEKQRLIKISHLELEKFKKNISENSKIFNQILN